MDSKRVAAVVRDVFAQDPGDVAAVYLYGSVARGTARASSDVDLGVLFATDPPQTLEGLALDTAAELEDRLGRPVQLVVLNRAPAELVHYVLRDGQLLLDRNPSVRIAFEMRKRDEYWDLLPFLRLYRRMEEAPL